MLKLVWIVATITAQGPVQTNVPETARFSDAAQCKAFGEHMTPRMADWVRGALRADWNHPVQVTFRCEQDGSPA